MLRIALLDDSPQCLEQMTALVDEFVKTRLDTPAEIRRFSAPQDLLDAVESGSVFNIYLLDVLLPGMSGIEVARRLRKIGAGMSIIFVTNDTTHAVDAFEVGATYYLIKGFPAEKLYEVLDNACHLILHERRRQILFSTTDGLRNLYAREIMYTTARKNYQCITLRSGEEIEVRASQKELAAELTKSVNFVRCGSSYVINLFYIAAMTPEEAEMADGSRIRIPRAQYAAVKKAYVAFHARISA